MNFPQDLSGNLSLLSRYSRFFFFYLINVVLIVYKYFLLKLLHNFLKNNFYLELCKLVSDSSAIYNDSQDLGISHIVDSDEDFKLDVKYV